jgi:protein gp37/tetratricopeptide (TPR) repeat protein
VAGFRLDSAQFPAPSKTLEAGPSYFTISHLNPTPKMKTQTSRRTNGNSKTHSIRENRNRRVSDGVSDELRRCELKVQTYQTARLEAGRALQKIQEDSLHKERGYETFENYGDEELDLSRTRLYQLIDYAQVHDLLDERVDTPPANEAQARPLAFLTDSPDRLENIWREALDRHDRLSKEKVKEVKYDLCDEKSRPDTQVSNDLSKSTDSAPTSDDGSVNPEFSGPNNAQVNGSDESTDGEAKPSCQTTSSSPDNQDSDEESSNSATGSSDQDSRSPFEQRKETYSAALSGLDEDEARSVLNVAENLASDGLTSEAVEESRDAYDRFLREHGGKAPKPLETDEAPSLISDLDTLPTLSGLKAEDIEISKEGERGMLVSLPITMIPDDLQPEGAKSCLVDYHALVDAGMPPHLDLEALLQEFRRIDMEPVMNKTQSGIDWAALSLNPVTGCRHGCPFCYARDIANRFYPQGFTPTFYPERLLPIRDATLPERAEDDWRYRNVFISSMGDLFGKWIPKFMVEAVLDEVRKRDEFTFSFLTKYAKRLPDFDFPDNAWVGASVIAQNWVEPAENAFADVDAENTWISAEPLKTDLTFNRLDLFDWVVYGGQTAASGEPAEQPEWKSVEHLQEQAREAGCNLFQKDNLTVRPMESPHEHCDSKSMPDLWK